MVASRAGQAVGRVPLGTVAGRSRYGAGLSALWDCNVFKISAALLSARLVFQPADSVPSWADASQDGSVDAVLEP